ncbi:hypothetical protein FN846DRAFT_971824 [Sphaerosporella brunnea]|uniref:CCHC-type domain-containing protein n=1 Tax=Sphaerosporella brunnea TaxID=1250544 RepID=A0A5J5EGW6_9PEZI|nr:hypothetical protein FN846DRAFT_971824 [Sphaerosporella brunnea]
MQRAAAASPSKSDTAAIKAATAEESARREAATLALRPRVPIHGGDKDVETQWELSYVRDARHNLRGLKVASVGFSELQIVDSDSEMDEEEEGEMENAGRLVFGNFKKKCAQTPSRKEGDSDENDSSDGNGEDDDILLSKKFAGKRNLLCGLRSISNAGNNNANIKCRSCNKNGHKAADCPKMECYACGGRGHISNDCPNPKKRRKDTDGGYNSVLKKARQSM